MSIGPLGLIGSIATTPAAQKPADADRAVRESIDQVRAAQSARLAEAAAGIGEAEEDSQAADRDADGRRLWQRTTGKTEAESGEAEVADSTSNEPRLGKGPSGHAGGELDLVG